MGLHLQALLALLAFPALAAVLFMFMPLRRAILAAYLLGWMFLPQGALEVPGVLPDYERNVAIGLGVIGALVLLDPRRLLSLRPAPIDLPMLVYLACPFLTSLSNGLGVYDGVSAIMNRTLLFAPPYLLGRVYFADREGLRQLAIAVVVGGIIYAPFCLLEARLSPQLHHWLYGGHQHSFGQTLRLGGWRPMVFMQHGLAVAMWMAGATMVGLWLRSTGALRAPLWPLLLGVVSVTTLLCKSTGALLLLALGFAALVAARLAGRGVVLALILAVSPVYVTLRATNTWTGDNMLAAMQKVFPAERVQSFEFRLKNETLLVEKAKQQPLLGWGGWGRNQIKSKYDDKKIESVTDGWWIIVFGQNGVLGLVAFLAATSLPAIRFVRAVPARLWSRPEAAPAAGLAVFCALYTVDDLMNAMFNPLNLLALGALGGLLRDRHGLARLGLFARSARGTRPGLNLALAGDGSAPWASETPAEADRRAAVATLARRGPQVAASQQAPSGAQEETQ